jgi:signal transduction histidine kinase
MERGGLDITLNIADDFGRLPGDFEIVAFRTIQECLTNIHRHSGSKTATIEVSRDSERFTIDIQDQGKGIPISKLAELDSGGSGVGIRGMRERLRQFEGHMNITSNGDGTRVVVTIPLPKSSRTEQRSEAESQVTALPSPSLT